MRWLCSWTWLALGCIAVAGCGGSGDDLAGPSKPVDAATDSMADASPEAGDDAEADGTVDAPPMDAPPADAPPGDVVPDTEPPACAPPSDPMSSAMCLAWDPEPIDLIAQDPRFDGQGVLLVQVFDTPLPEPPNAPPVPPIAELTVPDQPGGGDPVTMGVFDPAEPVRIEGLPETVHVRALFVDNFEALQDEVLAPGVWYGGYDFSSGLFVVEELQLVTLPAGVGTEVVMPMTLLRSLRVKVTKGMLTQPLGNGQGPAGFLSFDTRDMTPTSPLWGIGLVTCASIHDPSGIDIEGVVIGGGPYYGFGYLDDYGTGLDDEIPPGTMVNASFVGGAPPLPQSSEIDVPPMAYRVEATLKLTNTIPFPGLPQEDTESCF